MEAIRLARAQKQPPRQPPHIILSTSGGMEQHLMLPVEHLRHLEIQL